MIVQLARPTSTRSRRTVLLVPIIALQVVPHCQTLGQTVESLSQIQSQATTRVDAEQRYLIHDMLFNAGVRVALQVTSSTRR